jgi:mRNA interferase HigB
MHIISRKSFNLAMKKYPNQADALLATYKTLKQGQYKNPEELKAHFSSLDNFKFKDKWWVIDIGGNHLRLIVFIEFRAGQMYVKHIVNHSEYDKICKRYNKGEL